MDSSLKGFYDASSSYVQGMVYKKKIIDFEKVPAVGQMKQDVLTG